MFKRVIAFSLIALLGMPFESFAEESPKKPWKEVAEVSIVSTNGNSKSETISAKNIFTYDWTKWGLEVVAGGLGAKSKGSAIAEQYYASEKMDYKIDDKNYLFEKYRWDKDRFAGIDARHDLSAGYGRHILKNKSHELNGEVGTGYISEERKGEKRNDFQSGRAYGKYIYTISETANVSQDAEYIHNFENKEDYRLNTETALTSAMSTHLSLKVSYVMKRVGDPPRGFGKTDTITTVSLVVDY